jgi:CRISPR/Cas system-associated exonuclease Cas4 (RecB family)
VNLVRGKATVTAKIPAWSFSSIKTFEQCPKKFYHLKVVKDFQEDQNAEHLLYGTAFHEAAEFYIRDDTPLPPQFAYAKSSLDNLKHRAGQKLCEYEMGLTADLEPCGFKDPNVWWRGIADLIIINGTRAKVLDYKTGKNAKYADKGQLELMALAMFKHFPLVEHVDAGLLFVVSKDFITSKYSRDDVPALWEKWLRAYGQLKSSYANNVWNPRPSGLCKKHCVVLSCSHNGRS